MFEAGKIEGSIGSKADEIRKEREQRLAEMKAKKVGPETLSENGVLGSESLKLEKNKATEEKIGGIKEKIEQLKREIVLINKSEQESDGFKVKDSRTESAHDDADADKRVVEKEEEIRMLERQIGVLEMEGVISEKKERIEKLKEEISSLNKKEQRSFEIDNYKTKDRRSGGDGEAKSVEELVLEKEAEIRKLEGEISKIENPNSKESVKQPETREDKKSGADKSPEAETDPAQAELWREAFDVPRVPDPDSKPVQVEQWGDVPKNENVPESSETERKETGEGRLEELKKAVESTRKAFAARDYETRKKLIDLEKIFSKNIRTTPEKTADTTDEYVQYQTALKELRDYQIEAIKTKYQDISSLNPSEQIKKEEEMKKELGELYTYFKLDEKVNLYDARANVKLDARMKDREGRDLTWKEKIMEAGDKAITWYRKLPTKYKIAASAVLLGGGLLAGVAGASSVAAAIGVAKLAQRGIAGAAAGVGMVGTQEHARRWADKRSANKEKDKLFDEEKGELGKIKIENLEEKFKVLSEKLEREISDYDKALKREVRKTRSRKIVGWGVGITVGSGALAHVAKAFGVGGHSSPEVAPKVPPAVDNMEPRYGSIGVETDTGDHVVNGNDIKPGPEAEKMFAELQKNDVQIQHEKIIGGAQAIPEKIPDNMIGKASLSIPKGGSIEGTIIKHFTSQGMNKAEAGKMAHRMALQYAKAHNLSFEKMSLVHPGDGIKLSPDGKSILAITENKPSGLAEQGAGGHKHVSSGGANEHHKVSTEPKRMSGAAARVAAEPVRPAVAENPIPKAPIETTGPKVAPHEVPKIASFDDVDRKLGLTSYIENDIRNYSAVSGGINRMMSENPGIERANISAMRAQLMTLRNMEMRISRGMGYAGRDMAMGAGRIAGRGINSAISGRDFYVSGMDLGRTISGSARVISGNMELSDVRKNVAILGDAISRAERFNELRMQQGQILQSMASKFNREMVGASSRIASFEQMKNIDAAAFFNDPVNAGRGERLISIYKSLKPVFGNAAEPFPGERLSSWTRRIFIMTMRNKGVGV